jgi:Tfp pilus assembly protein PilO
MVPAMKRRLTNVEKVLLLALVLLGCFYFYLHQIYDPQLKAYESLREEAESLQQEITVLSTIPATRRVAESIEEEKGLLKELEESLTDTLMRKAQGRDEVAEAVAEIAAMVVANNLRVKQVSFQETVEQDKNDVPLGYFEWHAYTLVLEGSHANLVRLINALQGTRYRVVVKQITLRDAQATGNMEIMINIFI